MTHFPVASALPVQWKKATASNPNDNCIEMATTTTGAVPVRDSKDPHGPALGFTPEGWRSFVSGIRAGDFPTDL
ncbi:DUF397 domain-containing protein [Kitasatospora sp. NPDC051170]|uniref:DUF397 domain-containing protein n=1 Tax=Kitasatospora sp. NPDC051170 TaxID=3364056 RepID=UPI00379910F1